MINYHIISDSLSYYKSHGYKLIDVPWAVPEHIMEITALPEHRYKDNKLNYIDGCLVASAEQSFLHMIESGQLEQGTYCTITPCFRDDKIDKWHDQYFMKVELINYSKMTNYKNLQKESEEDLQNMINIAQDFFFYLGIGPLYILYRLSNKNYSNSYINIYLNGKILDGNKVGYPHKIQVLNQHKIQQSLMKLLIEKNKIPIHGRNIVIPQILNRYGGWTR